MDARGICGALLRRSVESWVPRACAFVFWAGGCRPNEDPTEIATYTEALTGVLEATLARTASGETSAGQYFGAAVSIDGDTALVGARGDAVGPNDGQGSAYVFVRSASTWTQQAKLVASDGAEYDHFGSAVSILGDTALVGSPEAEVNNWADPGAAYVFVRSGNTWSEQAKLVADDLSGLDNFGSSVALDIDVALVGAPRADAKRNNAEEGAAYVFIRAGSTWTETAKLSASDAAEGDRFGAAVALDGGTAIVGAPSTDLNGSADQGAAYVFARGQGGWTQQAALGASDSAAGDAFGASVSLPPGGAGALVGAPTADVGGNADQGAAYLFLRDSGGAGVWRDGPKLVASDGSVGDAFGQEVSLNTGMAVVAAPRDERGGTGSSSVYVFGDQLGSWSEQAKLTTSVYQAGSVSVSGVRMLVGAPYDDSARVLVDGLFGWTEESKLAVVPGGLGGDAFGSIVRLSGNTALVGRQVDGPIVVYAAEGASWMEQAELTPNIPGDRLGFSAVLEGDTAVVGSYYGGSAYVFTRTGAAWAEQARLAPSSASPEPWFGRAVALNRDTALLTAEGATYAFVRTGTAWEEQAKLLPSDGARGNDFGGSIALSGDTALVGAPSASPFSPIQEAGSIYVFVRVGTTWTEQAKLRPVVTNIAGVSGGYDAVLALEGNRALVIGGEGVRVIERNGNVWAEQAELSSAADGITAAALHGDHVLLGAAEYGMGTQGSVHLLERSGSAWTPILEIGAPEINTLGFGAALALDEKRALVGAPWTYGLPPYGDPREGRAYIYGLAEDAVPLDAGADAGAQDATVSSDGSGGPISGDGAGPPGSAGGPGPSTPDSGKLAGGSDSSRARGVSVGGGCMCRMPATPGDRPVPPAVFAVLAATLVARLGRRRRWAHLGADSSVAHRSHTRRDRNTARPPGSSGRSAS